MSNQQIEALCFSLAEVSSDIIFAFNAMNVRAILETDAVTEEQCHAIFGLHSIRNRLCARFPDGQLVYLGQKIHFDILLRNTERSIPSFLKGWAIQHGVQAIYKKDEQVHFLLASPKMQAIE